MLAIRFTFPGGRYHATPWNRHVNEADVEWPPSPWRIVRTLIALFHRKLDPALRDGPLLESLLAKLAEELPSYRLPEAIHAHSRHYMPTRDGKGEKKTLVFDAFARVDPGDALVAFWEGVTLTDLETGLLDGLLATLGFLGRAESWSEAQRLPDWSGPCDCTPEEQDSDAHGERIALYVPLSRADYAQMRTSQTERLENRTGLRPRERRAIESTLPPAWLAALSAETNDLRAAGWSVPPAARVATYLRPSGRLRPIARTRPRNATAEPVSTFRFALYGNPLPRIEEAIKVGECMRAAAMSRAGARESVIPKSLSGHGLDPESIHQHAFWLPEDSDDDGRIDHLLVHVPAKIGGRVREALETVTCLKPRNGQIWQLLLEGAGSPARFAGASRCCETHDSFESITPYLLPWHPKKGFGIEEQLQRECAARGLPEILAIEPLKSVTVGGRPRRTLDFHRFRSKPRIVQPDSHGVFVRLRFASPVSGPLALGFGCHFGLGLFRPTLEHHDRTLRLQKHRSE